MTSSKQKKSSLEKLLENYGSLNPQEKLRFCQACLTDPMTGLSSRDYFDEQIVKEIARYQRFAHPFSLVIVSLDSFKKINDQFGHDSGELAIKHLGTVLRGAVREVDTVSHFSNEEFGVILLETDYQKGIMISKRICKAIGEKPLGKIGVITASLGVATFPHDAKDREKLFELAEKAQKIAKNRGGNCMHSGSELQS